MTPTCVTCRDLAPHLNDIEHQRRAELMVTVVCHGDEVTCREFAHQAGLHSLVLADPANKVAATYDVQVTPFAFLLDAAGTILIRGVVNTWSQLEALLDEEGTFQASQWQLVTASPGAVPSDKGGIDGHAAGGAPATTRSDSLGI